MAWSGNFDFEGLLENDLVEQGIAVNNGSGTYSNKYPAHQNSNTMRSTQNCMSIADLGPGIPGTQISGVIIAKDNPRSFPNRKEPGKERHVLCFTLRDSPEDCINVTCWGEEDYIQALGQQYHIGDVVDIQQFMVQSKRADGTDDHFKPSTPTQCQITVSEKKSTISHSSGTTMATKVGLIHCPAKASNDYYTISDIMANGQQLQGETINIMAMVKSVSPVRNIVSKTGRHLRHCQVHLMDETATDFIFNLWSEETINLAQQWVPMDNVLFAADVRITHDEFKKTMVASANSKTVITANPDTKEAHRLYEYAQSVDPEILNLAAEISFGNMGANSVDLASVEKVCTITQLKEKEETVTAEGGTDCAIVYAHISQFNIDGDAPVTLTKCSKCRRKIDKDTGTCINVNCPQGSASLRGDFSLDPETQTTYNINVQLSDHTGSLNSCLLIPEVAQNMLQTHVEDFPNLDEEKKTSLKWSYLLERCKVYLKIILPSYERPQSSYKVLSCSLADIQEAVKFL